MKAFVIRITLFGLVCLLLSASHPAVAAEGNISDTNKYAWSENAGWLNFRPANGGVIVWQTHLSGYAWAENIGWIKLGAASGGGDPYYANTNSSNWGVNRDASNLSGYAWSETVGWINFNPSHSQVSIDSATGSFAGYAWSENVGWIHFKNANPAYNVQGNCGALASFAVDAPATGTAGTLFNVTITAKDLWGCATINVSGPIALSVDTGDIDPEFIPEADFTDDGVWTGEIALSEAGSGTITATNSGKTGSDSITINAAQSAPVATAQNAHRPTTNATAYELMVGGIGVTSYRFKVDDSTWSDEKGVDAPLTFTVDAEGDHTLYVIGKDVAGNVQAVCDATTSTWRVDTTPPVATINNYPHGTIGTTSINVIVGGTDVQYYKYRMDAGDWSTAFPVEGTIRVSGLADGDHTLDVIGLDTPGNWQQEIDATTATWTIDTTVPTAVLSNLPDTITNETSTYIIVSGSDVDEYKYSIDNGTTWTQQSVLQTIDLTGLETGTYTVYVNAYNTTNDMWQDDDSGETTASATMYSWTVDLTPPAAAELAAAAGVPPSTAIELSWSAVEDCLKRYCLWYSDSEINEQNLDAATEVFCDITPGPSGHTESFTVRGLCPDTLYYFAVKSEDAAGNVSEISDVASRTTANTLPTITGFQLTGGATTGDNSTTRELEITGTNFVSGAGNDIVRFISITADPVFDSISKAGTETEIYADVPAGAPVGTYNIRVINRNGTSALSEQIYTVTDAAAAFPEVTDVYPAVGPNDADTTITITGDHFIAPLTAALGLADGTTSTSLDEIEVVSASEVTATVPAGATEGTYHIQVHTLHGCNTVSAARFEIYEPVDLAASTGALTTTKQIDMPDDGIVSVEVILSTDDREEVTPVSANKMEIEATFNPGTEIMLADGTPYTGLVDPPRQVPTNQAIATELGSNAVMFTMGSPSERLTLGQDQTIFVKIDITMPSSALEPSIYYVEADGSLTPAGVDGERDGQPIQKGGTLLAIQLDVPEAGYTTYTFGLLLDHMSTYAAGVVGDDSSDSSGGMSHSGSSGDSRCFIATAAYGSPFERHVEILRKFRDVYLLPTKVGHAFVDAYYRYSPPVADFITRHDSLRAMVRCGMLPLVAASYVAMEIGPAATVALILVVLALISATGVVAVRRRLLETMCPTCGQKERQSN